MHQRRREIESACGASGVCGHESAEGLRGLPAIAELHQRQPKAVQTIGGRRVEFYCLLEVGDCFLKVSAR